MIDVTQTVQGGTLFFLHTKSATLALLASERGFLLLPYWGAGLKTNDLSYVINEVPFVSYMADTQGDKDFQLGVLPQFYPSFGNSDLRSPAFTFTYEDGSRTTDLYYQGYEVYAGKHRPEGLPYVRPGDGAETLEIQLYDGLKEIAVILSLTVYEEYDAVTQSVRVENRSRAETILIEKLCSASIDLPDADFEFLHLDGAWGREFQIRRQKLEQGLVSIGSVSGASGHNPFAALVSPGTDETHGQVYAVNFVYSGNFQICAGVDMHQNTRFQVGLHPFDFSWRLEPGERFQSPEAVLVYSGQGLEGMSHSFHRLYQDCLIPARFARKERPVLLNSWEAHYYQFRGEDLVRLAQQAAEVGAELFVLDDGWFGKRMNEYSSLPGLSPHRDRVPHLRDAQPSGRPAGVHGHPGRGCHVGQSGAGIELRPDGTGRDRAIEKGNRIL